MGDRGRMEVGPGMPEADVSGRPPFSQVEPLKCRKCGGDPEPGGEATPERGVWVVYYHDMGPHVESVHGTELEALRQVNDGTSKHAAFVPFGSEVREVLR